MRSTEINETKLHDTFEGVGSDEVVFGSAKVAAFARIGAEADEEGAADDGADDVDGGEVGFCVAADRVTLSERRGQDGSFA